MMTFLALYIVVGLSIYLGTRLAGLFDYYGVSDPEHFAVFAHIVLFWPVETFFLIGLACKAVDDRLGKVSNWLAANVDDRIANISGRIFKAINR